MHPQGLDFEARRARLAAAAALRERDASLRALKAAGGAADAARGELPSLGAAVAAVAKEKEEWESAVVAAREEAAAAAKVVEDRIAAYLEVRQGAGGVQAAGRLRFQRLAARLLLGTGDRLQCGQRRQRACNPISNGASWMRGFA